MARVVQVRRGWKAYAIGLPVAVLALALGARLVFELLAPLVVPALVCLVLLGVVLAALGVRRLR